RRRVGRRLRLVLQHHVAETRNVLALDVAVVMLGTGGSNIVTLARRCGRRSIRTCRAWRRRCSRLPAWASRAGLRGSDSNTARCSAPPSPSPTAAGNRGGSPFVSGSRSGGSSQQRLGGCARSPQPRRGAARSLL